MTQTLAPVDVVDFCAEGREAFRQFGAYANYGRALPDVRDGLKPIHRRILWAMWKMPARHTSNKVKAARAVGEVTGKYHPHGSSAAYQAMVGMTQPFNRLVPYIEGQGNWGSLSFGAAAERYTECRLTAAAGSMIGLLDTSESSVPEVDEGTVDMEPNYSGEFYQPVVLPALWPALVVNGVEGIGVGVATKSPSHNLREVLDLAVHMVTSPRPRMETVLAKLPGPDFPCDCDVFDLRNGIASYLETGSGEFVMRARWELERYDPDAAATQRQRGRKKGGSSRTQGDLRCTRIIITGLPYRVSPEQVVEGITKLVDDGLLPAMSVLNATSSAGIRIVVDVGNQDVDDILHRMLYHSRTSALQQQFSVNLNAVVDGGVYTIGIVDALGYWLHHRRTVIRRRSQFRLDRAQARLHLVEGFLKAIPLAREIVELIQNSEDRSRASEGMQQRWDFSELQCTAILDMTLGQITRLGVERYQGEQSKLLDLVQECNELLTNSKALDARLKQEIRAVASQYGVDRRSRMVEGDPIMERPYTPAVEEPAVPGFLVVTGRNWIRWVQRTSGMSYQMDNDYVTQIIPATDQNRLEMVTDVGWHVRTMMSSVPKALTNSRAVFANQLWAGEHPVLLGSGVVHPPGTDIVMVTNWGGVKRVPFDSWVYHKTNKAHQIITLGEGERVTRAFFLPPGADIAITTAYGRMLRLASEDLAPKGDKAKPVAGVRLDDNSSVYDYVSWAGAITEDEWLMYWTTEDQVGWFQVKELDYANRGTQGRQFTRATHLVAGMQVCRGDSVFWYEGSLSEPGQLLMQGQTSSANLSDRQLTLRASGIAVATSVWSA